MCPAFTTANRTRLAALESVIKGSAQTFVDVHRALNQVEKLRAREVVSLPLSSIRCDAGTQIRASIHDETVEEYAQAMADGAEFPPVIVFHDGNDYILADGFHRVMSASRNGLTEISADVRKGTKSDALKFALGANATHGIKRTNADKRRSVELALAEWPKLSSNEIAKICAVGNHMVDDLRKAQLGDSPSSPRIGKDGKTRKLPKRKPEPEEERPHIVAESLEEAHIVTEEAAPEPKPKSNRRAEGYALVKLAIAQLKLIKKSDTERERAFAYLKEWIAKYE